MSLSTIPPFSLQNSGSTISTLLHDKINPKKFQVLSLGETGFLQFFRVVSRDYGKPRNSSQIPRSVACTILRKAETNISGGLEKVEQVGGSVRETWFHMCGFHLWIICEGSNGRCLTGLSKNKPMKSRVIPGTPNNGTPLWEASHTIPIALP